MSESPTLTLAIPLDRLDRFCRRLLERSRDIAHTQDALASLQALVVNFAAATDEPVYRQAEALLAAHTETARQRLLELRARQLLQVILDQDLQALTALHLPLSRSGFQTVAEQALAELDAGQYRLTLDWASAWLTDARRRAEAASGFPDALDFKSAGVRIETFQAMADLCLALERGR
ncbi:hypothetical protein QVG61_05985 [Thiohalobacter sp. IOR34]|uniref:hypothetical protein n=1 Tax=Thiohalobacter sp. IOR34 TaxID=3057176 RepID=UPI0025B16C50|nr:hypothetical protein [Thiohalobacter sp. IOR34]WJW76636.1 hypothetical protein QVG61_05985 [Thiohalobacter sp. IOR34]